MTKENWAIKEHFIELIAEQRSEAWHLARKYRATASNYCALLGLSEFGTMEEAVGMIVGTLPPKKQNAAMKLGTEKEGEMRDNYCRKYGATCYEPSLCLSLRWYDFPCDWCEGELLSTDYPSMLDDPLHPNWFIAGSPDGILTYPNGQTANMEIKFPKRMYEILTRKCEGRFYSKHRLTEYSNELLARPFKEKIPLTGMIADQGVVDDYPHMFLSHYMQQIGCMFLTNQQHCAYVVGSLEGNMYDEMVKFDENFWRYFLYPSLVKVVELEIKPRMDDQMREEFTKSVNKIIEQAKRLGRGDQMIPFRI